MIRRLLLWNHWSISQVLTHFHIFIWQFLEQRSRFFFSFFFSTEYSLNYDFDACYVIEQYLFERKKINKQSMLTNSLFYIFVLFFFKCIFSLLCTFRHFTSFLSLYLYLFIQNSNYFSHVFLSFLSSANEWMVHIAPLLIPFIDSNRSNAYLYKINDIKFSFSKTKLATLTFNCNYTFIHNKLRSIRKKK